MESSWCIYPSCLCVCTYALVCVYVMLLVEGIAHREIIRWSLVGADELIIYCHIILLWKLNWCVTQNIKVGCFLTPMDYTQIPSLHSFQPCRGGMRICLVLGRASTQSSHNALGCRKDREYKCWIYGKFRLSLNFFERFLVLFKKLTNWGFLLRKIATVWF